MSLDHHDHAKVPAIVEREGEQDVIFVPRHADPLLHERDASILDLVDDGDHDLGEVDAQGLSSTGYSVEMTQMWHSLDGRRARHMRPDWYMPPREEKY